jgi:hypothetical protein
MKGNWLNAMQRIGGSMRSIGSLCGETIILEPLSSTENEIGGGI